LFPRSLSQLLRFHRHRHVDGITEVVDGVIMVAIIIMAAGILPCGHSWQSALSLPAQLLWQPCPFAQ
jgi:hypothetical protein